MATPPGKVPIAESAAEGLKFLTDNWRAVLPACVLMGIVYGFEFYAAALANASPTNQALSTASTLLVLIATIVTGASFYRLATRKEYPPPVGLSLGGDEAKYIGVNLWMILPIAGIVIVVMMAVAFFILPDIQASGMSPQQAMENESFMKSLGEKHAGPIALAFLLAAAGVLWLSLRLCLCIPASMDAKKIKVWQTAPWTKGNVWRILGAFLLLAAPLYLLTLVIQALFALSLHVNPEEVQAGRAAASPAVAIFGFVLGLSSTLGLAVPVAGLFSFLYKGLRPPN